MICTTNRTGSNLLCEALRNTALAGRPDEYFWKNREAEFYKEWNPQDYDDYLRRVINEGTTDNGVFGTKIMMSYFHDFVGKLRRLEEFSDDQLLVSEIMGRTFPNLQYIWLTRRDKVRQAISFLRALQTQIWGWAQGYKPTPKREPEFSFEQIDYLLQQIVQHEADWQDYFREANIIPFVVVYEDLCLKYEETAIQILDYLDISVPPDLKFGPRRAAQQADQLTEEWVQKFKSLKAKELEVWTGPWPSTPSKPKA